MSIETALVKLNCISNAITQVRELDRSFAVFTVNGHAQVSQWENCLQIRDAQIYAVVDPDHTHPEGVKITYWS